MYIDIHDVHFITYFYVIVHRMSLEVFKGTKLSNEAI